jgi:hypothetical protein
MNDEKHLRELIQAVLDGKPLQQDFELNGNWVDVKGDRSLAHEINFISTSWKTYRIKPEVKTFTYHTRVYMVNETIRVWASADNWNEKELEERYAPQQFKWLATAQTHTIECTE